MRQPRVAVLFVTAALLAGPSVGSAQVRSAESYQTASATPLSAATGPYRIGPQDILDVEVFQVPDLSKSAEVDGAGRVRLPLIGEVSAAGRTPSEFAAFLEDELRKTYLKDPKVSVTLKQSSSRRVTVDGAVIQPGVYPLTGPTTLIQALALARGPDPRAANIKRVAVLRNVDGRRQSSIYDLAAIRNGRAVDPEVRPDDIIVVDASAGKSLLRDLGGVMPFLGVLSVF